MKADLEFSAELKDGQTRRVVVETKVDSVPTAEQLDRITSPDGTPTTYVYFVLGYSAYFLPLDHCALRQWQVVGIDRWAAILAHLELPPDLHTYRQAVQREAEEHARIARAAATGTVTRLGTRQEEWAQRVVWLAQIRDLLAQSDGAWRDRAWSYVNGNAVQFGRKYPAWKVDPMPDGGHANLYVEVIANADHRWLAVKVGGSSAANRRILDSEPILAALLPSKLPWETGRRAANRYRTATVATLPLGGMTPAEAASEITRAIAAVEQAATASAAALRGCAL